MFSSTIVKRLILRYFNGTFRWYNSSTGSREKEVFISSNNMKSENILLLAYSLDSFSEDSILQYNGFDTLRWTKKWRKIPFYCMHYIFLDERLRYNAEFIWSKTLKSKHGNMNMVHWLEMLNLHRKSGIDFLVKKCCAS